MLGIGEKYSGGWVVLDWILMIALVVMVITFAIGAFWSAAVLLRQLVVRLSRRRALRAFPAANGW